MNKTFTGEKLQNYVWRSIKREFLQERRAIGRGLGKRECENFSEKPGSDVTMVMDDEGNEVSPLELMHYIPTEDEELVKDGILQALNLSK